MTKVYAIVSLETLHRQYRIWGITTSRANAEIACKNVKANNRAHVMLQILDIELDALCPDKGMVWRVVMDAGVVSQATLVPAETRYKPKIAPYYTGSYIAFVNTKYKEDACSEANQRRLQYSQ